MNVYPAANQLIEALPGADRAHLVAACVTVALVLSDILYEPGTGLRYAYFPIGGFISLMSTPDRRAQLELGLIGDEVLHGAAPRCYEFDLCWVRTRALAALGPAHVRRVACGRALGTAQRTNLAPRAQVVLAHFRDMAQPASREETRRNRCRPPKTAASPRCGPLRWRCW